MTQVMHVARTRVSIVVLGLASSQAAAQSIKLEPYAGKLRQISVRVADKDYKFLFDTGGGHTLISPDIAAAVGCKPSGRMLGFRMNGDNLSKASRTFHSFPQSLLVGARKIIDAAF